jgi:hypothetical protein
MKLSEAFAPFMTRKDVAAQLKDETVREKKGSKEEDKERVTVGDAIVSEGLSKEAVLNILQKNIGEIERCTLGSKPGEKLVLELIISSNGKIKAVKIVTSPFKDRNTEQCIIEKVKKWKFPATQGNREVKATVTLVFG